MADEATIDYRTNDPRGWCGDPRRGAAVGRPSVHDAPADFSGRLYLRRVRLDAGGYDRLGTYFGRGGPLYWCAGEGVDFMVRARDRADAVRRVRSRYPRARIRP